MTTKNPRALFTFKSIAMACAFVVSGCATGQSDGAHSAGADAGKALARDLCSGCHAIGNEGGSANAVAPPFRDLLARYTPAELEQKLPTGALMGHPDLPSVRLSQQGAKDLVAYLETLRPTP